MEEFNEAISACFTVGGGFGTRLRPITNKIPKCLVEIGGQPLLERWFQSLENCQCDEVLINTRYLAEQVSHI